MTGLAFVASEEFSSLRCPSGFVRQRKNLNQEAGGAVVNACVKMGGAPPFVADVALALSAIAVDGATAGMLCPPGYKASPVDLNQGVTAFSAGTMHLYACVKYTDSPAGALRDVRVVWGSPGGAQPSCPTADYKQVRENLNMGTASGLKTFLCTSAAPAPALPSAPAEPATAATFAIHPASEGARSCLTIAGGMAMAGSSLAEGLRLGFWTCRQRPTRDQQFYLFASASAGVFQLRVAHTQKCMTALNGRAAYVYQQACEKWLPDWQLWNVTAAGGGLYQVRGR